MMRYIRIQTPLGEMTAAGEGESLSRLDFSESKYMPRFSGEEGSLPVLEETRHWVELYFSGAVPEHAPALQLAGTPFQIAEIGRAHV